MMHLCDGGCKKNADVVKCKVFGPMGSIDVIPQYLSRNQPFHDGSAFQMHRHKCSDTRCSCMRYHPTQSIVIDIKRVPFGHVYHRLVTRGYIQCSRASRVLGRCKPRSSSLASTTSPRLVLLRSPPRSLRLGIVERTARSNNGHISSDVLPRNEKRFASEPEF
jgi:hypothetical protein